MDGWALVTVFERLTVMPTIMTRAELGDTYGSAFCAAPLDGDARRCLPHGPLTYFPPDRISVLTDCRLGGKNGEYWDFRSRVGW